MIESSNQRRLGKLVLVDRWVLALVLILLTAGAVVLALPDGSVVKAGRIVGVKSREWRATLIPLDRCQLTSRITGVVHTYLVEEGEGFKKGQTLIELDPRRARLTLSQAKAREEEAQAFLRQTRSELESLKDLIAREAATLRDVKRAEAQHAIAEARLNEAVAVRLSATLDLEACQLKAPFDGQLVVRRKYPGEGVVAHGVLCDLIGKGRIYAVIHVALDDLGHFKKGESLLFSSKGRKALTGRIAQIGAQVDPGSRSVRVKVLLHNKEGLLWPGSGGKITFKEK